MLKNHLSFNLVISKKSNLKRGDVVKIFDDNENIIEHAYLLNDPVKENGLLFADIRTQSTNKKIRICLTNAIQKI